jgi:hypothetical protein
VLELCSDEVATNGSAAAHGLRSRRGTDLGRRINKVMTQDKLVRVLICKSIPSLERADDFSVP